jgi:predicted DNA-binding transcriptional regulator YafY
MREADGTSHSNLRWSAEQRVAFAARRLFWDGSINREDLLRRFGVSINQATADLARLRHSYPEGFAYDTVAKRYRTAEGFHPTEASSAALLRELRLLAEGHVAPADSVLSSPPQLAIAELPERVVDADVLRALLVAIASRSAVTSRYISFQRAGEHVQCLSPHALVFDGFRWHVRAHDAGDDRFKDFAIARMSDLMADGPWRRAPEADQAWNTERRLEAVPHPDLDAHQRGVIAGDYGMDEDFVLRLPVREAMLFYVRRRLGLVDGHQQRPAEEQHIVLRGLS